MGQIKRWIDIDSLQRPQSLAEIKEIFYLTSSKQKFKSENERESWWRQWSSYYFHCCAEYLWFVEENNRVLGYLMGCPDSQKALGRLSSDQPFFPVFKDLFSRFSAHLHINFHPEATGKGFGTKLLNKFIEQLKAMKATGVHIVTTPTARNVGFYEKNGFKKIETRKCNGLDLLFMARRV